MRWRWLLACGMGLVWSVNAHAQPAAQAEAADMEAAPADDEVRALFRQGNEAYQQGRFQDAERLFRAAYDKRPAPDIAMNLGATLLELERPREAAELLHYALDKFPARFSPEALKSAKEFFARASAKVEAWSIAVNVPASVDVDGDALAKTNGGPTTVFVDPGARKLSVSADGYAAHEEQLVATAGGTRALSVTLQKLPDVGDGGAQGEMMPLWPFAIGTGALAAVGIGVGIGALVASGGADDDATSIGTRIGNNGGCNNPAPAAQADCAALAEALDDRDLFGNMAITAFIGAGVAALATAGLLIADVVLTSDDASESASVQVLATPFGAAVRGSY